MKFLATVWRAKVIIFYYREKFIYITAVDSRFLFSILQYPFIIYIKRDYFILFYFFSPLNYNVRVSFVRNTVLYDIISHK